MSVERPLLDSLFSPKAVAIVGASDNPMKLGGRPLSLSLQAGFQGRLFPVNSRAGTVQGVPAFKSLSELPEPVECAVLAVPEPAVKEALTAAAAAGARMAVIFAANYAEVGGEGAKRQQDLKSHANALGIRLLGPNCMGAFSVKNKFYPTFLQAFDHYDNTGWPTEGNISIVSQSGAIGAHLFVMIRDRGLGVSKFVTTGNQLDLDTADCIDYLASDSGTSVIAVYMEGIKDGDRLLAALSKATQNGKPVVILKVGGSETGATAILSHTASMAGDEAIADALFAAGGACRIRSLTELVEVAVALSGGLMPASDAVGVISLSGGGGVILADALDRAGFVLPMMPEAAQKKMREIVPFCAPRNPVDPGAPAMTDIAVTLAFLRITFAEGGYQTVFLFLTHIGHVPAMMRPLKQGLEALRREYPDRLLALVLLGPDELAQDLRRSGFLVFDEPLGAVATVEAMRRIGQLQNGGRQLPPLPQCPLRSLPATPSEPAARQVLRAIGIPVVQDRLVRSADEAAAAVEAFACCCALKLASPQLPHKNAIGGVMLRIGDADAARAAYRILLERWTAAGLAEAPEGVLVSPMVQEGLETIIGAKTDPAAGAIVMFGAGGLDVESNSDVVIRLAPVSFEGALNMLEETGFIARARRRFGSVPHLESVASAIASLSAFAARFRTEVASIDINPFIVLPDGTGIAVDALIVQRDSALTPPASEARV